MLGGGAEGESPGKCAEKTRKDFAAAGVVTEFCMASPIWGDALCWVTRKCYAQADGGAIFMVRVLPGE